MEISLYELFRTPVQVRIIEELLSNPSEYFTINKMAKKLNVSPSSVSARVSHLENLGLIKVISTDKAKVFSLNKDNEIVKHLLDFYLRLKSMSYSPTQKVIKEPYLNIDS